MTTITYLAAGGLEGAALQVVFTITGVLVFLLSLKYGQKGATTVDAVCGLIAAVAVAAFLAGDPRFAALAAWLACAAGYVAVIVKTVQHPDTENRLSWALTTVAGGLSLTATMWQTTDWLLLLLPATSLIGGAVVLAATAARPTTSASTSRLEAAPTQQGSGR